MEVRTQRLLIRPFELDDAPFILELLNDATFLDHIGDKGVRDLDGARDYLREGPLESYERNGFGLSCVVRLEDRLSIGMAGILKRDTLEFPDLGYAFLPRYCDQGYAFEATDAVLSDARCRLGLKTVGAIVSSENARSIHLLGKLGFLREGPSDLSGDVELFISHG